MADTEVMLDGLGFPESLRWHEGRLWLCNWGSGDVLAVAPNGESETAAKLDPRTLPFSIDWLPDNHALIIDGSNRRLLRLESEMRLESVYDLSDRSSQPFNELLVDSAGNAYVNGGTGEIVLVRPNPSGQVVADGLKWPNGMVLLDDERTLVVADSHSCELVAFDVAEDGTLGGRRTWATLEQAPDGICADAERAIWVASVPGKNCIRVQEGGRVLETVAAGRGCFSCMLGGEDGRTLYIGTAVWRGMEAAMTQGPGTTGQVLAVPGQPAPHAGRP